jgi:hypothetical protein
MRRLDFLVRKDELGATCLRESPPQSLGDGQAQALRRKVRAHRQQHHLCSVWRGDELLELLSGRNRLGADSGLGLRYRRRVALSWHRPGGTLLWLFPDVERSRPATPASFPGRLHGGRRASRSASRRLQQLFALRADPFHDPDTEDAEAILRPLYTTSWLIDDFLADNDFFGAAGAGTGLVVLSSASSKTAYGTAFRLARRQGIELVGLTSAANVGFCRDLACYHRVLAYDQLDQLDADAPGIYVDFAGNAALRKAIHARLVNLKFSSSIGGTHVEQLGGARDLPGAAAGAVLRAGTDQEAQRGMGCRASRPTPP